MLYMEKHLYQGIKSLIKVRERGINDVITREKDLSANRR